MITDTKILKDFFESKKVSKRVKIKTLIFFRTADVQFKLKFDFLL